MSQLPARVTFGLAELREGLVYAGYVLPLCMERCAFVSICVK